MWARPIALSLYNNLFLKTEKVPAVNFLPVTSKTLTPPPNEHGAEGLVHLKVTLKPDFRAEPEGSDVSVCDVVMLRFLSRVSVR